MTHYKVKNDSFKRKALRLEGKQEIGCHLGEWRRKIISYGFEVDCLFITAQEKKRFLNNEGSKIRYGLLFRIIRETAKQKIAGDVRKR